MCSAGHCSTFRGNGGVTQIGCTVRKENLLFPDGDVWLSVGPVLEWAVALPLMDFMMRRPTDKGHRETYS